MHTLIPNTSHPDSNSALYYPGVPHLLIYPSETYTPTLQTQARSLLLNKGLKIALVIL